MLEVALKLADAPLDLSVLVDLPTHPAAAAPVEEAHEPVRVGVAVAEELPEVLGDTRHRPARMISESVLPPPLDLRAQLRAHSLVGIETEHPVVVCSLHGELLLRAIARPVSFDHPCAERSGTLPGIVRGVRVHDDHLVTESDRAHAGLDAIGLVEGDDAG